MSKAVVRLHRGIITTSRQQWNTTARRCYTRSSRESQYSLWTGNAVVGAATTVVGISLYLSLNKVSADAPIKESIGAPLRETKQDADTKVHLPVLLDEEGHGNQRLVGAGVRTVTFLGIQVYVAGLYMDQESLTRLSRSLKGTETYKPEDLLHNETLAIALLSQPIERVIRIEPVRKTDFAHLRDGFNRAFLARLRKEAKIRPDSITDDEREKIQNAMSALKDLFPKSSLSKGNAMLVVTDKDGSISIEHDGKRLGTVSSAQGGKWLSTNLWLGYIGDDPISEKAKKDFATGLQMYL